jgi:chemotaxis protein CheZ
MNAPITISNNDVLQENLNALFKYVQRVREEIAALKHSGDNVDKFETMGQQLDGIVEATKDATDIIMDAVEKNGTAIATLQTAISDKAQLAILDDMTTNNNAVFEACAFQDLTGQRVTKIIKSVTYVEERVNVLREVWGQPELEEVEVIPEEEMTEDEKLLHGPQAKAEAISQDEIDKLFG